MKRIILHWTAGSYTPNDTDKLHYHFIIDGDGRTHVGKWPVSANLKPVKGRYAAHTLNCNSGSIGVAMACMGGAQERPYKVGKWPMTQTQFSMAMVKVADLCTQYGIKVTPQTVLTHAEVEGTLKIKQKGKWDYTRMPPFPELVGAKACGDKVRASVQAILDGRAVRALPVELKPAKPNTALAISPPSTPLPAEGKTTMLAGYKTYITALVAIVTAAGGYLTGEIALPDALNLGFTALLAAFIRNGIPATK
jgi:hypothetical protein